MVKSSENLFHFLKERFDMFRFTITKLKCKRLCTENVAKFSKSSAADVPYMSKGKKQNDFLAS